jgi:hypothetical protein
MPRDTPVRISVAEADPDTTPPSARAVQVAPPFEETCHWNVGPGTPLAATLKLASPPPATTAETGWLVIDGSPSAPFRIMLLKESAT